MLWILSNKKQLQIVLSTPCLVHKPKMLVITTIVDKFKGKTNEEMRGLLRCTDYMFQQEPPISKLKYNSKNILPRWI